MNGFLAAHRAAGDFDGAVGDHFVDVHVGLRAAAGLPDAQREVLVELSGNDFIGGLDDEPSLVWRSLPRSWLTSAAAFLRMPKERINSGGMVSLPMAKWMSE